MANEACAAASTLAVRSFGRVAFIITIRMLVLNILIFVVIGSSIRLLVIRPLNRVIPLLKDIAEGKALGDTTTLADASVVAKLKEKYEEEAS